MCKSCTVFERVGDTVIVHLGDRYTLYFESLAEAQTFARSLYAATTTLTDQLDLVAEHFGGEPRMSTFEPLFGRVPQLGQRGHCAQAVQCPGSQGCGCRRQLERELIQQQRGAAS